MSCVVSSLSAYLMYEKICLQCNLFMSVQFVPMVVQILFYIAVYILFQCAFFPVHSCNCRK